MEKLSGKGDIGTTCPKCNSPLEYEDEELEAGCINDMVRCSVCFARFSVHYVALDWVEL